ncbi:MAG: hypothetical protein ACLSAF_09325 [Intestinimonas sp.]
MIAAAKPESPQSWCAFPPVEGDGDLFRLALRLVERHLIGE